VTAGNPEEVLVVPAPVRSESSIAVHPACSSRNETVAAAGSAELQML
jgi:hypothetical protein